MEQKIAEVIRDYEFVNFSNEVIGGGSYRNVYVEFDSNNKLTIAERGEYLMKLESELIEKIDTKIGVNISIVIINCLSILLNDFLRREIIYYIFSGI